MTLRTTSDERQLCEIIRSPKDLIVAKVADRLNVLTSQFIERSPFVCVATASADGGLDVSPRGDPPGFVRIVDDPELLAASAVEGKAPRLGILVSIEEAYTQCPKALIRSDLWNPERHVDRSELPSSGKILRSLTDPAFDADRYDSERAERYARRQGLY